MGNYKSPMTEIHLKIAGSRVKIPWQPQHNEASTV